jgi:hypothetical protein
MCVSNDNNNNQQHNNNNNNNNNNSSQSRSEEIQIHPKAKSLVNKATQQAIRVVAPGDPPAAKPDRVIRVRFGSTFSSSSASSSLLAKRLLSLA